MLTIRDESNINSGLINQSYELAIDLIVMDIRMPIMNGLEATKIIKESYPSMKILILTTFADDEYALQALRLGGTLQGK